ncbi:MAG: alkaline phosphatase family protein [Chloroflexi bacterium]|nr:alkaline phosphatase family protein [Chloroflexota bacterium]
MRRRITSSLFYVLIAILLALTGYTAMGLTEYSFAQVTEYRSPFVGGLPSGEVRTPIASRVVIVLIDGLRADAALDPNKMAILNALGQRGANIVARTGLPSLSLPGWTVLLTGAPQEIHEVTTNFYEGVVPVDNLFAQARRAGLSVGLVGTESWEQLYGPWIDDLRVTISPSGYENERAIHAADERLVEAALQALDAPAQVMLIYFLGPDAFGHGFGAASQEYEQDVRIIDSYLGRVLEKIDLETTTLIITSDHGHLDRGGHGGDEPEVTRVPLVLVGAGIRSGASRFEVSQMDIAPTLAVLSGLPLPTHNQGRPLFEVLDVEPELRAQRKLDWARQQAEFTDWYIRRVGGRQVSQEGLARAQSSLDQGSYEIASQRADEYVAQLAVTRDSVRNLRLNRERFLRLAIGLVVGLLPLFYLLRYPRKDGLVGPLIAALVYFFVYNVIYFGLHRFGYSLSVYNTEDQLLPFFNNRLMEAAGGALLAGALVGLSRRGDLASAAVGALHTAFLIAYGLVLQILIFYVLWDFQFSWYLPDLTLGFKYYLDLLQLVAVGLTAPLLPVLAVGIALVARALGALRATRRRRPVELEEL